MMQNEPFTFFNTDGFVCSRNTEGKIIRFYLEESGNRIAKFVLTIRKDESYSPWMAPYGSLEIHEGLDTNVLKSFMRRILQWCKDQNLRSVRIINYPEFYFTYSTKQILNESGFQLECSDVCQYLEVTENLYSQLTYAERARLNKCKRYGFVFRHEPMGSLEEAYQLLTESRKRKGYPVTMTLNHLQEMFEKHPAYYHLFSVYDDTTMIAMAVSIHINNKILYNFYHADHKDYSTFSSTVMIINGINQYAYDNGYNYIDLGISSEKGILNKGLFKFKKNLGALESTKNRYYQEL